MLNRVFTISRELGSGGRTIGRKVAEKLGIPCCNAELIQIIAEESGYADDYYTDMKWGHAQNYHICLDSRELGIDQCVELISRLY